MSKRFKNGDMVVCINSLGIKDQMEPEDMLVEQGEQYCVIKEDNGMLLVHSRSGVKSSPWLKSSRFEKAVLDLFKTKKGTI